MTHSVFAQDAPERVKNAGKRSESKDEKYSEKTNYAASESSIRVFMGS